MEKFWLEKRHPPNDVELCFQVYTYSSFPCLSTYIVGICLSGLFGMFLVKSVLVKNENL